MSEELSIEQLRGVLQARFSELDAYRYMDQVLERVERADKDVQAAQAALADCTQQIAEQSQALADLDTQYAEKEAVLLDRFTAQDTALKKRLEHDQDELDRKRLSLATWQDGLRKIEADHQTSLASWQQRIAAARAEHAQVVERLTAAQAQFDALAAMIGKR